MEVCTAWFDSERTRLTHPRHAGARAHEDEHAAFSKPTP